MATIDSPETFVVITANLLREGTVVYRRDVENGAAWTADIDAATVYSGEEAADALAEAEGDARVVGAYGTEIAGRRDPISARERIRAEGPTIKYGDDALAPEDPDFSI